MIDFVKKLAPDSLKRLKTDLPERISSLRSYYSLSKAEKNTIRQSVRLFRDIGKWHTVIKKQTPHEKGVWGNTFFKYHGTGDINLVINNINSVGVFKKYEENNWLIHLEPQGYIKLLGYDNPNLIRNFSRIYTSAPYLYERGAPFIASPPYVPWNLGMSAYNKPNNYLHINYDLISNAELTKKITDLVCINSVIQDLPGHKKRGEFISILAESGCKFELWGSAYWGKYTQYKGFAPTKWEVFKPAKYVLVIENDIHPYYWSEKFADAILCYAMPIYCGCPNITDYFPKGSFIPIDINNSSSVDYIHQILNSTLYEDNFGALAEARRLILDKHNLFAFIDREATEYESEF